MQDRTQPPLSLSFRRRARSDSVLSEGDGAGSEQATPGGVRRVLGSVGRGILGVVATPLRPIAGAMHLVGRTTASLSQSLGKRSQG